jgi:hypothetical protein
MLNVTVFMQSECNSALAAAADLLFSPDISIYERRTSMPIRPIIRLGDPRLRQRSAEIEDFDTPGLQELIGDMFETMEAPDGAGWELYRSARRNA